MVDTKITVTNMYYRLPNKKYNAYRICIRLMWFFNYRIYLTTLPCASDQFMMVKYRYEDLLYRFPSR